MAGFDRNTRKPVGFECKDIIEKIGTNGPIAVEMKKIWKNA